MRDWKPKPCCRGGALPYDMGNAGDLLKHGALAEFVRWRCESPDAAKPFRFLDPFGGLPFCGSGGSWCDGENPAIERFRLLKNAAPDCALVKAQPDIPNRYYGGGHVVRFAAEENAKVFFSDYCPNKRKILSGEEGFTELKARGFDPRDGYSALNSINRGHIDADLVLIDPFGTFLPRKSGTVVPQMAEASERAAAVLFALNLDPANSVGRRFNSLLKARLPDGLKMTCPPIPKSGVRGEATYYADVVLAGPGVSEADELQGRLSAFAKKLAAVLRLSGDDAEMLKPQVIGRDG